MVSHLNEQDGGDGSLPITTLCGAYLSGYSKPGWKLCKKCAKKATKSYRQSALEISDLDLILPTGFFLEWIKMACEAKSIEIESYSIRRLTPVQAADVVPPTGQR